MRILLRALTLSWRACSLVVVVGFLVLCVLILAVLIWYGVL